jgi:hypothetical protein
MNKNKPPALNMPEHKKQETIDAVYKALEILNEKREASRECWSETWSLQKHGTKHTITMINRSGRFLDVSISLFVGCSQQRYLKRYKRQTDVRMQSCLISLQTGASVEEVEALFLLCMNQYVLPKQ